MCLIWAHLHLLSLQSDVSTWIKSPGVTEPQLDHSVVAGLIAVPSITTGPPEWSSLIKMQIRFFFFLLYDPGVFGGHVHVIFVLSALDKPSF